MNKSLTRFAIKDADRGEVTAVLATFDAVDADGDVSFPETFAGNDRMPISAYNHTSWAGALPVGIASIRATDREAIVDGQFFMDTPDGAATFRTVKRLHDAGLGEWSYGYTVLDSSFGEHSARKVRFLRQVRVHEVSPVLQGAGVGSRTLSAKSGPSEQGAPMSIKTAIRPHDTGVVNRPWDVDAVLTAVPDGASVSDLRSMAAWVSAGADPETKSAYKFWHHEGPNGAANVRACVTGIAVLNGARGVDASATEWGQDRDGIHAHLAGHIRDADREPPELRAAGGSVKDSSGGGRLLDEIAQALAGVNAASASTDRVVALRAARGKQLSNVNREYLDWLDGDLMTLHRKLRSYIDSPDVDALREFVRYVRHGIGGRIP